MSFNDLIDNVSRICIEGHDRQAHPSASGNISSKCEEIPTTDTKGDWQSLGVELRHLCNQHLLITTAGSSMSHVSRSPEKALGVIEVNETGDYFRTVWGFKGYSKRPTSELDTHARIHDVRGAGAVIHCHPAATNALMYAGSLSNNEKANKVLWQGSTEGIAYLPGGIEVLPWCVPGTPALGDQTAKAFGEGADAVLWDRHGLVVYSDDLDSAFNKVDTIEHTMASIQMALAVNPKIEWLTTDELQALIDQFNLKPRSSVWKLLMHGSEVV